MSYDFTLTHVGRFKVHKSSQLLGAEHKKRFVDTGVTPITQETLNIYAEGVFNFSIEEVGFSQDMVAGDTNISLTLAEFPLNAICTERVISETAVRYCVSPDVSEPWEQSVVQLDTGGILVLPVGACVFVVSGSISLDGVNYLPGSFFSPSSNAIAVEPSRLVIAK